MFDERFSRFQLFANCEPMDVWIIGFDNPDAPNIDLTRDSVQAAAESRLRSARLYRSTSSLYLHIGVTLTERAFGVDVDYNKPVIDQFSGESFTAVTWRSGSIGTHGGDASYVLSYISRHLDKFLVEYLRVNEEACETR